ncbi:MAG: hypothetical protein QG574_3419 [Cyanobacteriota bacterium erpe_2018_sw_21hr_WHONDRS-SW48-000092_B_bin.40]|nr:hypothetical protein [Cyanobacteriota bacterium erpe_2018_sw_21hr_WHONDRS-SW48-000092_B_bin.40]
MTLPGHLTLSVSIKSSQKTCGFLGTLALLIERFPQERFLSGFLCGRFLSRVPR